MSEKINIDNGVLSRDYFLRESPLYSNNHLKIGNKYLDLIDTLDHSEPYIKLEKDLDTKYIKTLYGKKIKGIRLFSTLDTDYGFIGSGFNHLEVYDNLSNNILNSTYPDIRSFTTSGNPMTFWGSYNSVTDINEDSICGFRRDPGDVSGNDYQGTIQITFNFDPTEITSINCQYFFAYDGAYGIDGRNYKIEYKTENNEWVELLNSSSIPYYRTISLGDWTVQIAEFTQEWEETYGGE